MKAEVEFLKGQIKNLKGLIERCEGVAEESKSLIEELQKNDLENKPEIRALQMTIDKMVERTNEAEKDICRYQRQIDSLFPT